MTVSVVGGTPDALLPVNHAVMEVDCWATKPGSNKPTWALANKLAAIVVAATWDRVTIARPLN